ncbi:MAG: hypothetical protein WAQ05_08800 [Rubrivivax sp.]
MSMPLVHALPVAGPAGDALRQAAADLRRVQAGGQPVVVSLALAQLARCYRGLGAGEAAEATFTQALRWSRCIGAADLALDLLCDLCDCAADRVARAAVREHAQDALQLAGSVSDLRFEVVALLRISAALARCGDEREAKALQTRAQQLLNGDAAA